MITTQYYDEFLSYSKMAAIQQKECNLGTVPHIQSSVNDDLMRNVKLYDVVNRKYAGFTQILLDIWYGSSKDHPYFGMLHNTRSSIVRHFSGWKEKRTLPEMLYVFMVHRLTGSGINYAKSPSGYHNTILPEFYIANSIPDMVKIIKAYNKPKYTSIGYQFPAFPKPQKDYIRGGDYFMCEMLPELCEELANFLSNGPKKDLREVGSFLFAWNKSKNLKVYKFQYAAVISDIADFYPEFVNTRSDFYYGSNAIECIGYMAIPGKLKGEKHLDAVMQKAVDDTGFTVYDLEDQMCDYIRWVENYIRPGADYDHLDLDKIWSSSAIKHHPYGRQEAMLKLGLVKTFNGMTNHPSDDYILKKCGLSVAEYQRMVLSL